MIPRFHEEEEFDKQIALLTEKPHLIMPSWIRCIGLFDYLPGEHGCISILAAHSCAPPTTEIGKAVWNDNRLPVATSDSPMIGAEHLPLFKEYWMKILETERVQSVNISATV